MARLTPQQIDSIVEDNPERNKPGYPSDRFYRHLYFIHYTLGEPWLDSFHMAHAFQDTPLPISVMEHIASSWNED